jgi:hypothetical protein
MKLIPASSAKRNESEREHGIVVVDGNFERFRHGFQITKQIQYITNNYA